MHYIIAVTQFKGGAGKTTLAISVAAELRRYGKGGVLIDADPQRSACQWAEPGHLQFPVYEITLADQTVLRWVREVNRVAENYRYVVIDTAPSGRALRAAITFGGFVIVPCTPFGLDLEATVATLEIIEKVRGAPPRTAPFILVPNRVDARTLEGKQLFDELTGFGEIVSPNIGYRSAFMRAFSAGRTISELPNGQVGHSEIQLLCDLVEKRLGAMHRPSKS